MLETIFFQYNLSFILWFPGFFFINQLIDRFSNGHLRLVVPQDAI